MQKLPPLFYALRGGTLANFHFLRFRREKSSWGGNSQICIFSKLLRGGNARKFSFPTRKEENMRCKNYLPFCMLFGGETLANFHFLVFRCEKNSFDTKRALGDPRRGSKRGSQGALGVRSKGGGGGLVGAKKSENGLTRTKHRLKRCLVALRAQKSLFYRGESKTRFPKPRVFTLRFGPKWAGVRVSARFALKLARQPIFGPIGA